MLFVLAGLLGVVMLVRSRHDERSDRWAEVAGGWQGPNPDMIVQPSGQLPEARTMKVASAPKKSPTPSPAPTPTPESFPETKAGDVPTSQPIELALELEPGTLSGWVADHHGLAVMGATIKLVYEQSVKGGIAAPVPSTKSNEFGYFFLDEVPPGRWTVTSEIEYYAKAVAPGREVAPGEASRPVELRMEEALALKGTVVANGLPMQGVKIRAEREYLTVAHSGDVGQLRIGYSEAHSDKEGAFEIKKLPPGQMFLIAEAPGYAPREQRVTVTAKSPSIEIVLQPESLMAGFVKSARGRAIEGAAVELRLPGTAAKDPPYAKGVTLIDGGFVFNKLPERTEFQFHASAENFSPAGPIPMVSGTTTNQVVLSSGGSIRGQGTNYQTGDPVAGLAIIAQQSGGISTKFSTNTNSSGNFLLENLPAGSFDVAIRSDLLASEAKQGVAVKLNKPADGVDFSVYPGLEVRGNVIDGDTGERLGGAAVKLQSRSGPNFQLSETKSEVADQFGSFVFTNLPQGIYTVSATKQEFMTGTGDESSQRIEVLRDLAPEPVELELFRGGFIEGTVISSGGDPIPDALVQVLHAKGTPARIDAGKFKTSSDGSGNFRIDGIPLTNEVHLQISAYSPSVSKGLSTAFVLNRRRSFDNVNVVLEGGRDVGVRVVAKGGGGIGGAKVRLSHPGFPGDPSPPEWTSETDLDGFAIIPGVPDGKVKVSASKSGWISSSTNLTLKEGGDATATLELEGATVLAGRVVDDRGEPFTGGSVRARAESGTRGGGNVKIGGDGTFKIASVGEGKFTLEFQAQKETPTGKITVKWNFGGVETNSGVGEFVAMIPASGAIVGEVVSGLDGDAPKTSRVNISGEYYDGNGKKQGFGTGANFSNGQFHFQGLPPGQYTVTANAANHLPTTSEPLDVPSPGEVSAGQLVLTPGGRVKFSVADARTGESIRGVTGVLEADGPRAKTNAKGEATISPVEPGIYNLALTHNEFLSTEENLVQVTRDGDVDLGRIEMRPAASISGEITDPTGQPLPGILVEAWPVDGPEIKTRSDGGGRWRMVGLPPGGVALTFSGKVDDMPVTVSVDEVLSVDRENYRDMVLRGGLRLTGNLFADLSVDLSRAKVDLYPMRRGRIPVMSGKVSAQIVSPGRFYSKTLTEGLWLVAVQAPRSQPSGKSYWTGIAEVFSDDNLTMVRQGWLNLRGTVFSSPENSSPVSGQEVRLGLLTSPQSGVPALREWWQWTTTTDENGEYSFTDLPTGTYEVFAHNDDIDGDVVEIVDLMPDNTIVVRHLAFQ